MDAVHLLPIEMKSVIIKLTKERILLRGERYENINLFDDDGIDFLKYKSVHCHDIRFFK